VSGFWMISIVLGIALKRLYGLLVVMTGKLWNAVVECTSSNVSAPPLGRSAQPLFDI
jgi:hypothetical protein